jgi:hypothetical protein
MSEETQAKIRVALARGAAIAHENRVLANATNSRREAREMREQAEALEVMARRRRSK